mmetsp:Transcript_12224/g.23419  ORF Transcript_12224/g.23419 Transcript_12224/m.23419 type:complete len:81 (+) Transcript_12224:19-261(+)
MNRPRDDGDKAAPEDVEEVESDDEDVEDVEGGDEDVEETDDDEEGVVNATEVNRDVGTSEDEETSCDSEDKPVVVSCWVG